MNPGDEWQPSAQSPRMSVSHVMKWNLDAPHYSGHGEDTDDRIGIAAFRQYFYSGEYSIFEDFEQHDIVGMFMTACSMLLRRHQAGNESDITLAISLYSEALAALQVAMQDAQQAKEDATLVATILVCMIEVSRIRRSVLAALTSSSEAEQLWPRSVL